MTELEGHGAFGTHVAAVLGQSVTHISHGTGAVVGGAVDDEAGAADAVAFVADFFVVHAFELTGALQNGVLNRVLGNIAVTSLGNSQTQAGVHVGIAASADACGYDDFTHKLGPEVGALGVLTALAVLNIGPFGMSGHFV